MNVADLVGELLESEGLIHIKPNWESHPSYRYKVMIFSILTPNDPSLEMNKPMVRLAVYGAEDEFPVPKISDYTDWINLTEPGSIEKLRGWIRKVKMISRAR